MIKRTAITGINGMVGRHLADLLSQNNIAGHGTSRTPPGEPPVGFTWSQWDLSAWKSISELDDLFGDVDALFHAGAVVPKPGETPDEQMIWDANVRSCMCLADWALERDIPVVYLSGAIVYADAETGRALTEDASEATVPGGGVYGFSKLLGDRIFRRAAGLGAPCTILRPSSIYGSGLHPDKMIASMLAQAARGETLELSPPINDKFNLIHARDVADAMLEAVRHDTRGVFNIAGQESVTVEEYARQCLAVTGNGSIEILAAEAARPAVERFSLDCRAAAKAFGYAPKISLAEGLKLMAKAAF